MTSNLFSRRDFIKGVGLSLASTAIPKFAFASDMLFPNDFLWGVATSAPESESRAGRGRSNWDVFIDNTGGSADGTTNQRNTEFETYYLDELKLLQQSGIKAFRFSFAWSRVQPENAGAPNAKAIAYYDRLIDDILAHGMEPVPTLFHFDEPLWAGNFLSRDISDRMQDYAEIMARLTKDRARIWLVMNEPGVIPVFGYGKGEFAPGFRSERYMGMATHHINLAHGKAMAAIRAHVPSSTKISSAYNMMPFETLTGNEEDEKAARFLSAFWNDAFPDTAYGGPYPDLALPLVEPHIKSGDMEIIACQPDFFGLNFYSRAFVKADKEAPLGTAVVAPPASMERTEEFAYDADTYTKVLLDAHKKYNAPEIIATEFGFAVAEDPLDNGVVNDPLRIKYMQGYLRAAHEAYRNGVNLKGMLYWSSADNWEWMLGRNKHFGLIHVDTTSLKRFPKKSLEYYGKCIKLNGVA